MLITASALQEGRSAFDAISYALHSHAAAAACKAAAPVVATISGAADAASSAEQALATLQAGLRDERMQWEEELMDGGTLLRLADDEQGLGEIVPEERGRSTTKPFASLAAQSLVHTSAHPMFWLNLQIISFIWLCSTSLTQPSQALIYSCTYVVAQPFLPYITVCIVGHPDKSPSLHATGWRGHSASAVYSTHHTLADDILSLMAQVTVVWEINRLRRSLMLIVLAWASSLHDPATYARSYPTHQPAGAPALPGALLNTTSMMSRVYCGIMQCTLLVFKICVNNAMKDSSKGMTSNL